MLDGGRQRITTLRQLFVVQYLVTWQLFMPENHDSSSRYQKREELDRYRGVKVNAKETKEDNKAPWMTLRQVIDPAWKTLVSWHDCSTNTHSKDSTCRWSPPSIQVSNGLMGL